MTADEFSDKSREELIRLARVQESALATYKETLSRIYHEFDAKVEELSLIRRVADLLRTAQDLSQLSLGLVEVVISEISADVVLLMLADPEMTRLLPAALVDRAEEPRAFREPSPEQSVPFGQGELGRAISQGRVLLVPDLEAQPLDPWPADLPGEAKSLLALPLMARQQILGAMILVAHATEGFGDEHTRTLSILCDHAAAALVNLSLIDQLGEINERLLSSELEAHQAREYLQNVLDTASDLILIAGPGGDITYANQAAGGLGLGPGEIIGRPLIGLFTDPARAAVLLAGGRRTEEELELGLPGGGARLMLASATPLQEPGEHLVMLRDITHRRALERQLMHAEKLASVGILAAGVAHEIGNPLSAISGYAQLLTKEDVSGEERVEFAGAMYEQAERINKIIRDLLDYSRPSPYQGQSVAVNQAIEAVLNMFFTSKRLASQDLAINRDLARGLAPVVMDRDQLQQVVLNMVMNAAQAMGQGGVLTISTRMQEGWVRIRFADTGPGIPAEHLTTLFDPFFTTKPPGQGTGLGLSICDRIISAAGGRIEVKSRPGKGATFDVWLPGAE